MKVKQEDGTEIEVLSPEEVQAKIEAEKAQWQKEADERDAQTKTALEAAIAEKAKLEADLAAATTAGGSDSANFKILKSQLDEKDKAIKTLQENDKKNSELRMKDIESEVLGSRVKAGSELEKKVRFHYENTLSGVKAVTREEISKKIDSAIKLAADATNSVDIVGSANFQAAGFSGQPNGQSNSTPLELTAVQKDLAKKLGITDEDLKKFGPKIK